MPQFKSPFPVPPQPPSQPELATSYQQWPPQPPQLWSPPQPQYFQPPPQVMPPHYMLPPFYQPPLPPMPQPSPKRKAALQFIIGACAGVLVMIVLVVIIGVAGLSKSGNAAPLAQATATPSPTAAPTPTPTPTATPVPGINQAIIGGTEAAFTAKFGAPASTQTQQNGVQDVIYNVGTSTIGQLGLVLVPGTDTVYGIVIEAPNGQSWDATTAVSVCISYLPSDSTLDHPQNITDSSGTVVGLFVSGYSAELASTLSPTYFNDAKGTSLVKPGTFSIRYTSDSIGSGATQCAIRLGMQPTSE